jgi:DNA polymerase III delta prime subunit
MTSTKKLIGPAGKLSDLFARTCEDAVTVKLLLTGAPGTGKTSLANQIALSLTGEPFATESVNGRKCSIHVVAEWQRMTATSCMFGTGWRAFVVNEIDTCPADAQDLLLTFLDEMPANCAFIATSNLELDKLTPRFISRLERHEVGAPEPEEIAQHLHRDHGCPPLIAQQIAFLCGGNVRAAEIDAKAWQNQHAPTAKRARVAQASFSLGNGVSV